jgi:peptidoglycan/xylan/chitin deacetylase (PgdA/CDA1 family)
MAETSLGIVYPTGDVTHPSAEWWKQLAITVDLAIREYAAETGFVRGVLPDETDLNTVTAPGVYSVESSTSAATLVNAPAGATTGAVLVTRTANGNVQQQYITTGTPATIFLRGVASVTSGTWGTWRDLRSQASTTLSGGDMNAVTTPGIYYVPTSGSAAGIANHPDGQPGVLEVFRPADGIVVQRYTSYGTRGTTWYRATSSVSTGNMTPWRDLLASGGSSAGGADAGPYRHTDLVARARLRRGGRIGTGGLAAVALRFDHHLDNFRAKVLPLLRKYNLPWAQAINPQRIGTGDDNATWAELQGWCLDTGGEVWNHSGNHGDAATEAELDTQIAGSLATLQANLPALAIEGWCPPGLADGQYMGASPFKTTEQNTGTYAGRLIMGNHAFVAGYAPGVYRVLDPTVQPIGAPHITIDRASLSSLANTVGQVVSRGAGIAFMLHPNYLDQDGFITTADLETFLADLAARRDAGELVVLSYSGLWVADIATGYRHNLAPATAANLAAGQALTVNLPWARTDHHYGSTREIVLDVTATAATTLTIAVGGRPATTHQVPAGTSKVRRFVTLPADISADLPVVVTPAAALRVDAIRVYAA